MRPAAALLAGLLLAACAPAAAKADGAAAIGEAHPATGSEGQPILVNEGGILRPIANGGRVALRSGGWARLTFSPFPLAQKSDLDVALEDAAGRLMSADVVVEYEMLDMDHGHVTEHAVLHQGRYRAPLSFSMYGAWKFAIRVTRGSNVETLAIVVGP